MLPVIALVGRPNVGKSTLFNRITRSKDALVADFPGLTRDRKYKETSFEKKPFLLIDTGGIGVEDTEIDDVMSKQSKAAIEESTLLLFVVDGRDGLTPQDQEVANFLRKQGKPIYLVINKLDGMDESTIVSDFLSLGFQQTFAISASHNRGVHKLLESVTAPFSEEIDSSLEQHKHISIAFIGRPNVGKSTLINRILGEERVVVFDMPGTTRDSLFIPFERASQDYVLIDTAGIRRRGKITEAIEKFSIIKTLQAIKESNVCLLVIDAQEGITDQDLHLLGLIIESGKALVIVINKWDGLDIDHKDMIKSTLERKLVFAQFAKIKFVSALHGTGVGHLFKDILQAYDAAYRSIPTPKLTKLLLQLIEKHPPPMVKGRRIKLRYAHMGGHNPPLIVIHGNQVDALPVSYRRYLVNGFIEHFKLVGTPVRIELKGTTNPYQDRKNELTQRQIHKKKRLKKHLSRRSKK